MKPANILYEYPVIKLSDFGCSFFVDLRREFSADAVNYPGIEQQSLWYRSPEILFGDSKWNPFSADMWAAGMVFAHLCLGKPMLPGKSQVAQILMILDVFGRPPDTVTKLPHFKGTYPVHKSNCLHEWVPLAGPGFTLLKSLLDYDTKTRLTADLACQSEYLSKVHCFFGRSARAVLAGCVRHGRLSSDQLLKLNNELDIENWPRTYWAPRDEGGGEEMSLSLVPELGSTLRFQGNQVNGMGKPGLLAWFACLQSALRGQGFFEKLEALRGLDHAYGTGAPRKVMRLGPDSMFGIATIKRFHERSESKWHVDGGPSTVFMAIALEGWRVLELKDCDACGLDNGVTRILCEPGHIYVSNPSCFQHRVMPHPDHPGPSTTLILRSPLLFTRVSERMNYGTDLILGTVNAITAEALLQLSVDALVAALPGMGH